MSELTKASKRKITADWHSVLPELGIYRPMWLLRRCGPLLTGICLDRDSSGNHYIPTTHVHCLANPSDNLFFGLCQRLRAEKTGADNWIRVQWHDKHWREAAHRTIEQSLLPLTGSVSYEQMNTAFRGYRRFYNDGKRSTGVFRDWLLTLAWTGRGEDVRRLLGEAQREIATWPEYIIATEGGLSAWLQRMRQLTSSADDVRRIVDAELVKHEADKLPSIDISSWLV